MKKALYRIVFIAGCIQGSLHGVAESPELKKTLTGFKGPVLAVAFNHDGTKVASGSAATPRFEERFVTEDTYPGVKIWNVATGNLEKNARNKCRRCCLFGSF